MVAKIGTVNCSVIASASGSSSTAPKVHTIPISPTTARARCAPIRSVRMLASPGPAAIHATTSGTAHAWRKNIVSGRPAPRASASLTSACIDASSPTESSLRPSPAKMRSGAAEDMSAVLEGVWEIEKERFFEAAPARSPTRPPNASILKRAGAASDSPGRIGFRRTAACG